MQRITDAFAKAKSENRGAFVAYFTLGFPSLAASEKAVDDIIAQGADVIELGVPFSDPFADGGVIRSAAYEALRQGVSLADVLAAAKRLRAKHPNTAFVLFSYYNPVFSMGLEAFAALAAESGIDAVLSVDLPLEERKEFVEILKPHGISYIPLIAPNTPLARIKESEAGLENSFLYVITVKGTTGARAELPLISHRASMQSAHPRSSRLPPDSGFRRGRRRTKSRATLTALSSEPRSSNASRKENRRASSESLRNNRRRLCRLRGRARRRLSGPHIRPELAAPRHTGKGA